MDTKQIWSALERNKITEKKFDGIFASNFLEEIVKKPQLVICNTDPSNKPGKHWVLFYFENDDVDFFDSLGNDIEKYGKTFVNFIKRYSNFFNQSNIRTQPINSDLCGEYCLYYAYNKCKGKSMTEIVNTLSKKNSNEIVSDVYDVFCICKNSKCSLLQNCQKC